MSWPEASMNPIAAPANATHRRILFVAEAVTLAHVARPCVLAQAINGHGYQVHFPT